MRGPTDEIARPAVSLADGLSASFRTGTLVHQLVDSFDAVLAPVVGSLDDLDAYLDPRYAPDDFLSWVGTWLSMTVDRRWPAERVRSQLGQLRVALLNRGTLRGVRAGLVACTGTDPDLRDNGGVVWSNRPNGALPGRAGAARLDVRVWIDPADDLLRSLVTTVVDDLKPAHVVAALTFAGAR